MLAVLKKVLEDGRIESLVTRIIRASEQYIPNNVIMAGYDRQGTHQCVDIFSNPEDFESRFRREELNGRIVKHVVGTKEYECLTDVVDGAPEELHGEWVIAGTGLKPKTYTTEEMRKTKAELLKTLNGWMMIHQLGTTTYTLINAEKSRTRPTTCSCQKQT